MSRKFDKEKALLVYRTMVEYQHENDFSMTTRMLAEKLGYQSNSPINHYLTWLKKNGYVKSLGRQVRAIPRDTEEGQL